MIIKISTGGNHAGGVVRYMAGPGDHREHVGQRTIAGGTVHYDGPLDEATVKQVIADLQAYQSLNPDTAVTGGAIWQCSIAVAPEEGPVSDETWGAISRDLMQGLGFTDPTKADVRWAIFGHGESMNGNPHCHIVMNRVREDGTKVNTFRDMVKAQKLAPTLEVRYGLRVLESRLATVGAGSVPYTSHEVAVSRETGRPIERVELERRLRALAAASQTEAEFVRRARADGLLLKPFPKAGEVTGYSVALPPQPGERPLFFQGGKVARDLTLPALQRSWPDAGGSRAQARDEWRNQAPNEPVHKGNESHRVSVSPDVMMQASQGLSRLGQALSTPDPVEFAEVSGEIAGALAAASLATEGARPGELAKAAREVGAWAQTHKTPRSPPRSRDVGRGVALVLLQALHPDGMAAQYLKQRRLVEALSSLHRLHRTHRSVAATLGRNNIMTAVNENTAAMAVTAPAPWWVNQRENPPPRQAVTPRVNQKVEAGWTAADFRRFRIEDKVAKASEQARAKLIPPDQLATLDQRLRAVELADKLGLPGIQEAVEGLDRQTVGEMIAQFEVSAENLNLVTVEVLPDVGLSSATAIGEVKTPDQAAAFLADLERKAQAREAARPAAPRATSPAQQSPMQSPAQPAAPVRNTDPRTWATARSPVTKSQRYTLKEAGFGSAEIAALDKGHASVVITELDKGVGKAGVQKVYDNAVREVAALNKTGTGLPNNQPVPTPPTPVRVPQRGGR